MKQTDLRGEPLKGSNNALRQAEAYAIIRAADDMHENYLQAHEDYLQEEDMVWQMLRFGS